ncbi:cathepsin L-like proteinase [Diabrotica undecimpunctata]|uniref:cathepsin L-like proteinase n=1 Tax=Diabrotica undecimpunctata TaxID=50387 RepID=UPI003B633900
MKVIFAITCLIVIITAEVTDYQQWMSFKARHSKQYKITEDKLRFQIFQDNLREIEEHNARYTKGEVGWFKGVTPFADWTKEEFQGLLTRQAASRPKLNESLGVYIADPNVNLPSSVDWRNEGAVLPVREQGFCGSCWAFSTVGALEGQAAIHKQQKIPLSPQNLIDCSDNDGCGGGDQVRAFQYVQTDGISSEADYPYIEDDDQMCQKNVKKSITSLSGYKHLNPNEEDLISAIATVGPISVSAISNMWSLYAGGIYDNRDCGTRLNHALVAVGYAEEYILLKNSWGTDWGEDGYIKVARGHNVCQINKDNSYPIL